MLAMEFAIAQATQEPTTAIARTHRSFGRMIKTGGFAFDHQGFAARCRRHRAEQRREDCDLDGRATRRAGLKLRLVDYSLRQRLPTLRARNQGGTHAKRLLDYHARIADVV